jgi:hypothetical protein
MHRPLPEPENPDETTDFIIEGTHRLATISLNDYGYLLSARMAQTYLARATLILESRRSSDRNFLTEIKQLKAMAPAIAREYAQFETFCQERERFDHQVTKNWIEWISKWTVRAVSSSYCGTVSHLLAYKIRTFHSRVCALLTEK